MRKSTPDALKKYKSSCIKVQPCHSCCVQCSVLLMTWNLSCLAGFPICTGYQKVSENKKSLVTHNHVEPLDIQQRHERGPAPGEEKHHTPVQAGGPAEKNVQILVAAMLTSRVPFRLRKQMASWAAQGRALPAGWGRSSSPSTSPKWGFTWSMLCPVLGCPGQERPGAPGMHPAKGL